MDQIQIIQLELRLFLRHSVVCLRACTVAGLYNKAYLWLLKHYQRDYGMLRAML